MISQELMDEIIYISLKQKIVSKDLIEKIVFDILDNSDEITQNLFGGLFFEKARWDFAIAALDENFRIIADYDEMVGLCEELTDMTFLEKNLYIIHYIFHEMEHLKEESKIRKNNYESKILKFGNGEYIYNRYYKFAINKIKDEKLIDKFVDKKYKLFYKDNWSIIPSERIAEITARKNILDSLRNYPDYQTNFFSEHKRLTSFYINGLKLDYIIKNGRYNIPIIEYFSNLGMLDDLQKIGFNVESKKFSSKQKGLDTEIKMMYGFPITPRDMIEINKKKIKGIR